MINVGDTLVGEVTKITDFGVFVMAEGIEILLPLHELSWERIGIADRFAKVGETVSYKVIQLVGDDGTPRFIGSPKQADPDGDPWRDVSVYSVGSTFEGPVIGKQSYGVFVRHPFGAIVFLKGDKLSEVCQVGERLNVSIDEVDVENRRISGRLLE